MTKSKLDPLMLTSLAIGLDLSKGSKPSDRHYEKELRYFDNEFDKIPKTPMAAAISKERERRNEHFDYYPANNELSEQKRWNAFNPSDLAPVIPIEDAKSFAGNQPNLNHPKLSSETLRRVES